MGNHRPLPAMAAKFNNVRGQVRAHDARKYATALGNATAEAADSRTVTSAGVGIALLQVGPGAADDLIQSGMARLPAEFVADLLRRCDEHRGISGAARLHHGGDGMSGDAAGAFDDLLHAKSLAVAEVVNELLRFLPRLQPVE